MKLTPNASVALLLLACCFALATAAAFECGAPGAPCSSALPENVTCEQGSGYCQPGYYCGQALDRDSKDYDLKCRPVPKDCGLPGKPCCPSNAEAPHTNATDKMNRRPFCTDGGTCLYDDLAAPTTPDLAGVIGLYNCAILPKDCGAREGSTCCPTTYKLSTNPRVPPVCAGPDSFCNWADPKAIKFPGHEGMAFKPGVCYANKPDCGTVGKTCCERQGFSTTSSICNGAEGVKTYCDFKGGEPAGLCTVCPDKVDPSDKEKNPSLFNHCS